MSTGKGNMEVSNSTGIRHFVEYIKLQVFINSHQLIISVAVSKHTKGGVS